MVSPVVAGGPETEAPLNPQLRGEVITHEDVLQPVRPVFAQPELGVFEPSVAIAVAHVLTETICAADRVRVCL